MRFLRLLLAPFSLLFLVITELRNLFYNVRIFRASRFDLPVISVGNLSVGGTGKTPHIEYLLRLLKKEGLQVATLSRGYRRKTKGYMELNVDSTPEEGGDEPLQFKKKFPDSIVTVDSNRVNGVMHLIGDHPETNVVLLDDAYQHRAISPGLNILLTDYSDPFVFDFILPVGNLREIRKNADRADIVVVTKCSEKLPQESENFYRKSIRKYTDAEIFFSFIKYGKLSSGEIVLAEQELKNKTVLLVTGIANPASLVKHLSTFAREVKHLSFPDHHRFTENDIKKIEGIFGNFASEEKIIVTTEKDAMRLLFSQDKKIKISDQIPVFIQEIEIGFFENEKFENRIKKYVRENY